MTDEILIRKDEFKNYMQSIIQKDGTNYNETQINAFCYSLEQATAKLKVSTPLVYSNIFSYDDVKVFNRAYALIVAASNYSKVDMATGNRTFSGALLHYSNFLKFSSKNGKKSQLKAHFTKYFNPVITVLRELEDDTSLNDICDAIILKYNISETELSVKNGNYESSKGTNKFSSEIYFAINYLVKAGLVDYSEEDNLILTASGKTIEITDGVALNIFNDIREKTKSKKTNQPKHWIYPIQKMYKSENLFVSDDGVKLTNWTEFKENKIITIPFGELGDLRGYKNKSEIKSILTECFGDTSNYIKSSTLVWEFVNEMNIGDIIIVQEGNKILGRGMVYSDYGYDENREDSYNHTREIKWTNVGEWILPNTAQTQKTTEISVLTNVSKLLGYLDCIKNIFDYSVLEVEEQKTIYPSYNEENFLTEVYMKDNEYKQLTDLLRKKKNIILQGSAGVGKTYISKRLAYSLIGEKNQDRVKMIQFHQNYSYEDFFMGYRPTPTGLELQYGVFYKFCKQAELDNENDYYFIIDEINRGNLSKIFGELFMLIENDKRDVEIQLTYTQELFVVPENIYIIGTMNTADRGLALLDYALRRRFGFYEIIPAFESVGFMGYQAVMNSSKFNKLINEIKILNKEIEVDENLGKGFAIGHSYFGCDNAHIVTQEWMQSVIDFEILPLLNEYWFDEANQVKGWKKRLNEAIQ